ncbi:MAG: type II toxin-antitoxin system HicA family toxin [Nitrospirales bacterium]|nr:type II toxin-antitoxin system HicA family toxin [Nitrospirales bacterium]
MLGGASDANIAFADIRSLLLHLGFEERIRGSHHIYRKAGIGEKVNLQRAGDKAKPYQIKQVRGIILNYKSAGE